MSTYAKLLRPLLLVVAATAVFTAFAAAYLFLVYPRLDLDTLPVAAGAVGGEAGSVFRVYSTGRVPYLWENGLPYPTDVDDSNVPRQTLNGRWLFRVDAGESGERDGWYRLAYLPDSSWQPVNVPSTYNAFDGQYRHHQGVTWYRTRFNAPVASNGETVRLAFRGILLRSRIWLNGRLVAEREGGYTPFYVDVTDDIQHGDNLLVVRADNRLTYTSMPPRIREDHSPGWGVYGGIYRDVYLERLPGQYVFKIAATPGISDSLAVLDLSVLVHRKVALPALLGCEVRGPDGSIAATCSDQQLSESATDRRGVSAHHFNLLLSEPRLYSPASPVLYTLTVQLRGAATEHRSSIRIGLRSVGLTPEGITLNGRRLFLAGISKHEDDPAHGATQTPEVIARDLELIREMGANYIRLSHYPHAAAELAFARDRGILLSEEIPFYTVGMGWTAWFEEGKGLWSFPARQFGLKQLYDRNLLLNAQRELIEMIERDRNNPAIILWGVGNESYTIGDKAGRVYGWLRDIARAFDDSRPVTAAEMSYDIPLFDDRRQAAAYVDIASVNLYLGWYGGSSSEAGRHLDRFRARFPQRPIILSEFGADAAPGRKDSDGPFQAERVPPGRTYSESYQARLIQDYMTAVGNRPFVAGVSPWIFADFYCPWFPGNPVPYYNLKGVVSRERRPKESYYTLQSIYRKRSGEFTGSSSPTREARLPN